MLLAIMYQLNPEILGLAKGRNVIYIHLESSNNSDRL